MAKRAGVPVWQLLSAMSPAEIVALVDFRYLTDALTPGEALELLERAAPGRREREAELLRDGYPAYTTSVGWLGYDDDKIRRLCREALAAGWTRFKMKVGADVEDDVRRMRIIRDEIGPDRMLAVDANQRWDVGVAIDWMAQLAPFDPYWIEEPTSPDDILGHAAIARAVAPIRVATGEHVHNRIMFKQFLAAGALSVCQIDACRLGGVNEVVAVLLLAAKFGVTGLPACRRRGPVRAGPAPVRLRLHRGERAARRPDDRVRRPPARAFRRSGGHRRRAVPVALGAGLQLPDAPGVAGALRLSGRVGMVVRRFGQVIRVKPGSIDAYERLHAETWPGVLAAIAAANIRNYSIYRHDETLFAYFEYVGDDLAADMAAMAANPTIVEWWALTDAMQVPYPEREPGSWWLTLPEVFHTG